MTNEAVPVLLEWFQRDIAAHVGRMRHKEAIKARLLDKHGAEPWRGLAYHVLGAAGEMALAKYLNVFWSMSVNTFKSGGDVGGDQVRTRSLHWYELVIRKNDDPDAVFWLITGGPLRFYVQGWIPGWMGMRQEFWTSHAGREPQWFVPQNCLFPPQAYGTRDPAGTTRCRMKWSRPANEVERNGRFRSVVGRDGRNPAVLRLPLGDELADLLRDPAGAGLRDE